MGSRKITISDVADALGVSKTTVSRAISGKGRVGEATRNQVLNYIEEHGYVPNAIAKSLAQSHTYNIGLAVPQDFALTELSFFQNCLMGICDKAVKEDYDVVITMTSADDISQLERMVLNQKVDGVIITRTLTHDSQVELLKEKGIPFVTIGSSSDDTVVQVDNDHEAACEALTNEVIASGNTKNALISGEPTHVVTQRRMNGFLKAMKGSGALNPEKDVYEDREKDLKKTVAEIVKKKYDCILCMDDSICLKVLDELKNMGVNVPKDIRVASFYNSKLLERNTPSITSLKFDARELGETAARTLIDMIDMKEVPDKTLLGYEISIKESTLN